jgi:hypothetical protein
MKKRKGKERRENGEVVFCGVGPIRTKGTEPAEQRRRRRPREPNGKQGEPEENKECKIFVSKEKR